RREIVIQPVLGLLEHIDQLLGNADFLFQFAQRAITGRFALVDAALRHLPLEGAAAIDAPAHKDATRLRKEGEPDIGTIAFRILDGRFHPAGFTGAFAVLPVPLRSSLTNSAGVVPTRAETGASRMPFWPSSLVQIFAISMVIGNA